MNILPDRFYHLYNRSNRGDLVFTSDYNYTYFLKKVEREWQAYFEILCYCLMPTHFHFLIYAPIHIKLPKANYAVGKLLSSYTRARNLSEGEHGSLFQSHTKCKDLVDESKIFDSKFSNSNYIRTCFNYIHQNPKAAGIVKDLNEWEYSSYNIFAGVSTSTICNIELAEEVIGFKRGIEFIKMTEMESRDMYQM